MVKGIFIFQTTALRAEAYCNLCRMHCAMLGWAIERLRRKNIGGDPFANSTVQRYQAVIAK